MNRGAGVAARPGAVLEPQGGGRYRLDGCLDSASATRLWREAPALFDRDRPNSIDLSAVEQANSAGVALLLAWLAQARGRGESLTFINWPEQMKAIMRVSSLDPVFFPDAGRARVQTAGPPPD